MDHGLRILQILFRGAPNQRFQVLQIHAGAECLSRSSQDQHDGVRVRHFIKRTQQIIDQFEADGIALLRAIQSERCQFALKCELNRLVWHTIAATMLAWLVFTVGILSRSIGGVRLRISSRQSVGRPQKSIEWLQGWQLCFALLKRGN